VVGDVLDLIRHRPAVGLAQPGKRIRESLAGDVEAQDLGRDLALELFRERRLEPLGIEGRIAAGLAPERIEAGGQMTVHAVCLDERHRRRDGSEEPVGRSRGWGNSSPVPIAESGWVKLA
jgi:hypothetical protein